MPWSQHYAKHSIEYLSRNVGVQRLPNTVFWELDQDGQDPSQNVLSLLDETYVTLFYHVKIYPRYTLSCPTFVSNKSNTRFPPLKSSYYAQRRVPPESNIHHIYTCSSCNEPSTVPRIAYLHHFGRGAIRLKQQRATAF